MARRNYSYEKRQKDLARKKQQELKRQRRQDRKNTATDPVESMEVLDGPVTYDNPPADPEEVEAPEDPDKTEE